MLNGNGIIRANARVIYFPRAINRAYMTRKRSEESRREEKRKEENANAEDGITWIIQLYPAISLSQGSEDSRQRDPDLYLTTTHFHGSVQERNLSTDKRHPGVNLTYIERFPNDVTLGERFACETSSLSFSTSQGSGYTHGNTHTRCKAKGAAGCCIDSKKKNRKKQKKTQDILEFINDVTFDAGQPTANGTFTFRLVSEIMARFFSFASYAQGSGDISPVILRVRY